MWSHFVSESEPRFQIFLQMLHFFDLSEKSFVEFDLKVLFLLNVFLIFFSQFVVFFEKHIIRLFGLLFSQFTEIIVIDFVETESTDIDFGGSRNHVGLVEPSQRNSVHFIRPGGQNQT